MPSGGPRNPRLPKSGERDAKVIHQGDNVVDGIPVEVVRKRIRRLNLRISPDGRVHLSLPLRFVTLREAEKFLSDNWKWVLATRGRFAQRGCLSEPPLAREAIEDFKRRLSALHEEWCGKLGENDVALKVRPLKSMWGSCHWRKRVVTYNSELARAPRELVEYVVVHELCHLAVHDHGPRFYALMDGRLPGWRSLRRRLSRREFGQDENDYAVPLSTKAVKIEEQFFPFY